MKTSGSSRTWRRRSRPATKSASSRRSAGDAELVGRAGAFGVKMPSPFPGMDPYLESPAHWPDFHHRYIDDLCDAIAGQLPDAYVARIGEEVVVVDADALVQPKSAKPDVLLARERRRDGGGGGGGPAVALEPVTLANVESLDPLTEGYIEILHLAEHEVVTVVELLSPANKGSSRSQYLEKRQ